MIELVRKDGSLVDHDELVVSDVIIPPSDLSFEEASEEFSGDGLIPG
jgi:PspAA-like protein